MDGMYGFHSSTSDYSMSPENLMTPVEYHGLFSSSSGGEHHRRHFPMYGSDDLISVASAVSEAASVTAVDVRRGSSGRRDRQVVLDNNNEEDDADGNAHGVIKAKIASHPSYPKLLDAFIDCQKVGAPPEMACLLDEIRQGNEVLKRNTVSSCFGSDPELDEFMETYCDVLVKYKSDLARPFDEATTFLSTIETQLSNLCKDHEAGGTSDEELSGGEAEVQETQMTREERELKDTLLRKFGGHISSLKHEFSKKKKKGKLPPDARQTLLEWWNLHDKWPFPTISLSFKPYHCPLVLKNVLVYILSAVRMLNLRRRQKKAGLGQFRLSLVKKINLGQSRPSLSRCWVVYGSLVINHFLAQYLKNLHFFFSPLNETNSP